MFYLIPLIFGLVLLFVFLYFRVKEKRLTAVIIKGFVSLLFIITAIVALLLSKNPSSSFGIFVIIGLVFASFGDVLLDLKFMSEKYEHLYTVLGFIAFALCHLCYTTGLFLSFYDFERNIFYLIIPIIITILLVVVTLLMEKIMPIRYGNMKPYVVMYGIFLFFAVSIFFSTAFQYRWQNVTLAIFAPALILFMVSDLILNNTYFSKGCNTPLFIISNHLCYYLAQFAIALSLFYLL